MGSLKLIRSKLLIICLAALGVVFVAVTIFKVSIGNLLYFAVFLACPLMHIFMMKGHGGHDHKGKDDTKQNGKSCH
ncbi:DUF2933 domain-containing protein [Candidatus Daviesbacteria bacterium]|nr:DUF2933 domain-containing protein [Candidatus Daviesbacteria bacterium]